MNDKKNIIDTKQFENVISNLNKEIQKIGNRTIKGLIKAVALIRRDMDKTPPLIPVNTGNLRSSWFTSTLLNSKNKKVVIAGFSANYAISVHEAVGASFKRPDSGAKFYEVSIKRNKKKVLEIIRDEAKIE